MAQTARKSCVVTGRALQRAPSVDGVHGSGFFSLRLSLGIPYIPPRFVGFRHYVGETRPVIAMHLFLSFACDVSAADRTVDRDQTEDGERIAGRHSPRVDGSRMLTSDEIWILQLFRPDTGRVDLRPSKSREELIRKGC